MKLGKPKTSLTTDRGVPVHCFPLLQCADLKIPKSATQARKLACRHLLGDGPVQPNWWVFTFVRHPLDRLVSLYCNHYARRYKCRGEGFKDFVVWVVHKARSDSEGAHHWLPQVDLLEGQRLDFIGRYESLQRDWGTVRERYPQFKELSVVNKSTRRADWRSYYDSDSLDLAAVFYEDDLAEWEYEI